jgi:hypothetical protein
MPTTYAEETSRKMKELIGGFFKAKGESCHFSCNSQVPLKRPDWVEKREKEARMFCLGALGLKDIPLGDFSDRDLEVLGFSREEVRRINEHCKNRWKSEFCLKSISCFDYALLKAKEPGVREQIFSNGGANELERLNRWGYDVVDEPKRGDIVVYIDIKVPTHMGYYMGDGLVISKFGSQNPNSSIHPLDMVHDLYGFQIAFYRKNPAKKGVYHDGAAIKLLADIKK